MLTVQHSMQKMAPLFTLFEQNRLYFIILLPSFLPAKSSHLVMFDGAAMFVCAWRRRGGGVLRLNSWAVWKGSFSLGLNLMRWSMTLKIHIHKERKKKKNELAGDSIGLLHLYVSCGPPLKMWIVFETWNPSFWLPRVGFSFDAAEADRNRSGILFQVTFTSGWDTGQR